MHIPEMREGIIMPVQQALASTIFSEIAFSDEDKGTIHKRFKAVHLFAYSHPDIFSLITILQNFQTDIKLIINAANRKMKVSRADSIH